MRIDQASLRLFVGSPGTRSLRPFAPTTRDPRKGYWSALVRSGVPEPHQPSSKALHPRYSTLSRWKCRRASYCSAVVEHWQRRQDRMFGTGAALITTPAGAERFLERVGIALRYGANDRLPLASLQRILAGDDPSKAAAMRATGLTNHLLGQMAGIEVHVIAGRVAVVHRRVMPALYVLVRRGRPLDDLSGLTLNAQTTLALLGQRKEVSAGDVRHRLGLPADPLYDQPHAAPGELTRILLVDRGPFEMPKKGIHYLPPEGYPYHLFHQAHADLVSVSEKLTLESAADAFLGAYLDAATFARPRTLTTMFKLFLSAAEIEASLARLVGKRRVAIEKIGSATYCVTTES